MKMLQAFVIFACVLIAHSHDLLPSPRNLIEAATKQCPEAEHPGCQAKCVLEKSHLLTASGDAIDPAMCGPLYAAHAKECAHFAAKPTCEEAEKFVTCFIKKTEHVESDLQKKCEDKYPVAEDMATAILKNEDFDRVEKLPCLAACLMEHMFNEDDTVNLHTFNPLAASDLDLKKAVAKCEAANKQDEKCLKRASIFACVIQEHELATNQTVTQSE